MPIFFFLFLLIPLSYAQDCGPEVDLSNKDPMRDMAILDQDGSGLCYGYTAAQLVEFEMRARGTQFKVSPVDLSAKAGEGFFSDRSKLSGGMVGDVVSAAQSKGVVSRECMEAAVQKVTQNTTMTSAQFVHLLELIYDKHKWSFFSEQEYYDLKGALLDEQISGDIGNKMAHLKGCDYQAAMHHLQDMNLLGKGVTGILKKMLADCKSREVYSFQYKEKFRSGDNDKELAGEVDALLGKGKPASLYFCAASLVANNTENFWKKREKDDKGKGEDSCGAHALLVTGKRNNGGKCEYLLRNSWGAQWNPPGVTCACKLPNGKYFQDCKEFNKEITAAFEVADGQDDAYKEIVAQYKGRTVVGCWFPAENIIQNSYGVGGVQ